MPLPVQQISIGDMRQAIQRSFYDHWCDRTRIAWGNLVFDPGDDDAFVRFAVNHTPNASGPAGIESGSVKRYRRRGIIFVQVFTRGNTGQDLSDELTEKALKFFETVDPVLGSWYRNPSPAEIPGDGTWMQVNVSAELIYDTLRA